MSTKLSLYHLSIINTLSFKDIAPHLETYLGPRGPLRLLIDRSTQDVHEEKLPSLFFWDRARLLFYKRASCCREGGYTGFQFVHQDGDVYLRWSHITRSDSILPWVDFVKKSSGSIFFLALEAGRFLRTRLPLSQGYHLLLYSSPSQQTRHIVFKGKHLLLSRLSHTEEDLKGSLHFLSRTYTDIHDNLEILKCDAHELLAFISSQKKPCLSLSCIPSSYAPWKRRGAIASFIFSWVWAGAELYEGFNLKSKIAPVLSKIVSLKKTSQTLNSRLKGNNVRRLQKAMAHYKALAPYQPGPLQDFTALSSLLKMYPVHLENVTWRHDQHPEITLIFLMECKTARDVLAAFESFLLSAHEHFPNRHVQVLEAPFHSSPHEAFKDSFKESLPRVQLTIKRL